MKSVNFIKKYSIYSLVLVGFFFTSCKKNGDEVAPDKENEEEVITDIKLIFTNDANPSDIVEARAQDPDGAGVQELQILDEIDLDVNKSYTLTFEIMNNLDSPGKDIAEEITKEAEEHQFFFSFSNDAFSNPTGNGNIDAYSDPLNYNDTDGKGNPIGLSTSWTTPSSQLIGGTFTVRLQHQPDLKNATSGANDGDTDIDLQFVLNINGPI